MSTPAEWTAKRYRVTFERIGRDHDPAPLELRARNADELALLIYRHVKGRLASDDIDVHVDLEALRGSILAGFHLAGTFVLEPIP